MKKNIKLLFEMLILPTCIYYSFLKVVIIDNYNILTILSFIVFIVSYNKIMLFDKKSLKEYGTISLILSLLYVVGESAFQSYQNSNITFIDSLFSFDSVYKIFSSVFLIYLVVSNLYLLYNKKIKERKIKISDKKFVLISFVLIFLSFVIYYVVFFPGILSPDSISELEFAINDFPYLSNHHPLLHTLFIGFFYKIGMLLFDSKNIAVALVTVAQMFIMSTIFSYSLFFLRKRKCSDIILILMLLVYIFMPVNGYYSVTMWKDVIFAGLFLLLTMTCYELYEQDRNTSNKTIIKFIVISLLTLLMRNNAIYAYFIVLLGALLIFKNNKKIIYSVFSVIIIYYVITIPIFNVLKVQKSSSSEYIAIPLQQIGRIVYKDCKLTKNEKELINKIIPYEKIKEIYDPKVSDGIKFDNEFNIDEFNGNKLEYLKLWLKLVFKYPIVSVESYLISTLGYYYPNLKYWSVATDIVDNGYNIHQINRNSILNNIIVKNQDLNRPIFGIVWSTGFYIWIIIILMYYFIIKLDKKMLFIFTPTIGIWLSLMIASPVWGEFRYIYCIVIVIPFLLSVRYINKGVKNEK